jgi:hypothetical protein
MGLLDAVVAEALAIDVNVSNLSLIAVEDTGDLLESGATGGKVSFDSKWRKE